MNSTFLGSINRILFVVSSLLSRKVTQKSSHLQENTYLICSKSAILLWVERGKYRMRKVLKGGLKKWGNVSFAKGIDVWFERYWYFVWKVLMFRMKCSDLFFILRRGRFRVPSVRCYKWIRCPILCRIEAAFVFHYFRFALGAYFVWHFERNNHG